MPNLITHMGIAYEGARRLGHPDLQGQMGSYLLGSVSPDIRIMTKWPRDQTHFAPLSSKRLTAGVKGLFREHPELARPQGLNRPTRAFIAGYISHLVADQAWILALYRPFFGNREVFQDRVLGNIMDRALQLELDRKAFQEWNDLQELLSLLRDSEKEVRTGFIDEATLRRWRELVVAILQEGFSWERLRRMVRFHMGDDSFPAMALVEEFLESVPQGLERLHRHVPQDKVQDYWERSVQACIRVVRKYLETHRQL